MGGLYRCNNIIIPSYRCIPPLYYGDTNKTLVYTIPEDASYSDVQPTTEDGVLTGEISVKYTTAKTNGVSIRLRYLYSDSPGHESSSICGISSTQALAGNKELKLKIGNSPYGFFIPKGTRLTFDIYTASGGTRTLTNTLRIYALTPE